MRRRYLAYLLVAVLPSMAAVAAGIWAGQRAWRELGTASWSRVGTMALNALQEELVGTVASLASAAEPTQVNPQDPAWARVAGGDTVSALRPRESGAEVMVLTRPRPGDPPGSLRYAAAPLPDAPRVVARAAGSRLSLYLNGQRALATADSLGPDTLPRQALIAASDAVPGLAMDGEEGGVLVALDHPVGLPPSVAVLVGPVTPPAPLLPLRLLLVAGLLFLFACAAGWIQLGATREGDRGRRLSMLVVSLVPVLTALGFLVQTDRLFREAARTGATRDLTRALAVSSARGILTSPGRIHQLTGFQATRVRDGRVEESTLREPLASLAELPSPPPSFSSSGAVTTSEGPSLYVARRLAGGGFVAVSARRPDHGADALRRTLLAVAGALGAWLVVMGWMAGVAAPPREDPPVSS